MELTSDAFAANAPIPAKYTCEGANVAPPLRWSQTPEGTRSLALVVEDPDAPDPEAPQRTWVHWILYDIPPALTGLPEGGTSEGVRQGTNDWNRAGWGGPCPPIGRHRYFFRLYALDVTLDDQGPLTRAALDRAMEGHVIGRAELIGTYEKQPRRGGAS